MLRATLAAASIAFGLTAFTAWPPSQQPEIITITNDGGGSVGDHLKFFNYIRAAHVPVRVEGSCVSACTLILTLPPSETCIEPYASLGFHLASVDDVPDLAITTQINDRYYPAAVRKWIEQHGPLTIAPIYMSGMDAIALSIMRACKD